MVCRGKEVKSEHDRPMEMWYPHGCGSTGLSSQQLGAGVRQEDDEFETMSGLKTNRT